MRLFDSISQPWRYRVLVIASLTVSSFGVLRAIHLRCPAEGGRGGAVATALAFWALYLRPDYGRLLYRSWMASASKDLTGSAELAHKLDGAVAWLEMNSDGQTTQNRALAAATVIGTLFWGFGDVLATHLLQWWINTRGR